MSSIKFNANGVNSKITINTNLGSSAKTNADNILMSNVEQNSYGGEIEHNAGDLTQVGGSQSAINKGKITNSVDGGTLTQVDLKQSADSEGEILNQVKKN